MIDKELNNCNDCIWGDQCECDGTCDYYYPVDDDEYIDNIIENKRYENRMDWFEYIEEYEYNY